MKKVALDIHLQLMDAHNVSWVSARHSVLQQTFFF